MKRLHLIFGVLVVLVFLLTGQYMDFQDPKVRELTDEGTRMMFRSRHIYLLLAGLINLGVGVYFTYHRTAWRKSLQVVGSALIRQLPDRRRLKIHVLPRQQEDEDDEHAEDQVQSLHLF